jgi:hypothetical protein
MRSMISPRAMAAVGAGGRPRMMPLRVLAAFAWAYLLIIAIALSVIYRQYVHWTVVAPLIVAVTIVVLFFLHLRRIERTLPYFEVGAFYVGIAAIYILYPLTKFVLLGYSYDEGDTRMMMLADRPEAFVRLTWWYVLYLASFCVVYVVVRGGRRLQGRFTVRPPGWPMIVSILILFACARCFFLILGLFFDMRVTSYMDSYLVIQRLPLVVRQIAAQVQGIDLTLQMMLVIALTCGKRRSFRILLVIFLTVITITHLLAPGGRIHLVAVIVAALAAHHLAVRKLPFRWMAIAALLGFVTLLVMAAVRTDQSRSLSGIKARMSDHTEFEVIFGNAVDLMYVQDAEGVFLDKPGLYWSGLTALVPQQILPVVKDTSGAWYARTYYPEYFDAGGGLAFGILAEGVTGFGWPEMLWRGALVGLAFALVHRSLYRPHVSVYLFIFSVWVTVWAYMTLRNGMFGVLMLFVYRFVVPAVSVVLLSALLPRGHRFTRRLLPRERSVR